MRFAVSVGLLLAVAGFASAVQISTAGEESVWRGDWLLQTAGPVASLWTLPTTPEAASASGEADLVLVSISHVGTVSGISPSSGRILWRVFLGPSWRLLQAQPVRRLLFVLASADEEASAARVLFCVDSSKGALLWRVATDATSFAAGSSSSEAAAAAADEEKFLVALASRDGLEGRDGLSGELRWTAPGGFASPLEAVAGGDGRLAFCGLRREGAVVGVRCVEASGGELLPAPNLTRVGQASRDPLSEVDSLSFTRLGGGCLMAQNKETLAVLRLSTKGSSLAMFEGLGNKRPLAVHSFEDCGALVDGSLLAFEKDGSFAQTDVSSLLQGGDGQVLLAPVSFSRKRPSSSRSLVKVHFDSKTASVEAFLLDLALKKQTPFLQARLIEGAARSSGMDSTSAKAAFSARIASAVAAFGGEDEEPRLFLLGKDLSLLGFDRRGLVWKREDGLSLAVAAVVASLDAADSPKTEVGAATGGESSPEEGQASASAQLAALVKEELSFASTFLTNALSALARALPEALGHAAAKVSSFFHSSSSASGESPRKTSSGRGLREALFEFRLTPEEKLEALGVAAGGVLGIGEGGSEAQRRLAEEAQSLQVSNVFNSESVLVSATCNLQVFGVHAASGVILWGTSLLSAAISRTDESLFKGPSNETLCCCCQVLKRSDASMTARSAVNGVSSLLPPSVMKSAFEETNKSPHSVCRWRLAALEAVGLHRALVVAVLLNETLKETVVFWIRALNGEVVAVERLSFAAQASLPLRHFEAPAAAQRLHSALHNSTAFLLLKPRDAAADSPAADPVASPHELIVLDPLQRLFGKSEKLSDALSSILTKHFALVLAGDDETLGLATVASREADGVSEWKTTPVWRVDWHAAGQKVLTTATPLHRDSGHVGVYVQSDITLAFRLLNPDLVAVLTQEVRLGGRLFLHLLDGRLGRQLASLPLPPSASLPAFVAVCEDTVYVQYWEAATPRFELFVATLRSSRKDPGVWGLLLPEKLRLSLESLFGEEGDGENDFVVDAFPGDSYFSALPPHARAYVMDTRIATMGLSQTKLGITPRALILADGSSRAFVLSSRLADAQRPLRTSAEERGGGAAALADGDGENDGDSANEHSLDRIPYSALLSLPPQNSLSVDRQVLLLHGVLSVSSSRESSSLAFLFGHDILAAPAQPAGGFDVLPASFSTSALVLGAVAAAVGAILAAGAARRRALKQKWQ